MVLKFYEFVMQNMLQKYKKLYSGKEEGSNSLL